MATYDAHANLANSLVTVAPSPDTSGTSLTVDAGHGALFPAVPFNCIVCPANVLPTQTNAEIIRVTAVTSDTFTITRAQEGTTAKAIAVGYYIANAITVKTLTDVEAAASAPPINTIAAATGDQAGIASGDNNIAWNWQKTTNSETALTLGESAASTGGTSTAGVPNQVLLKLATVAASTMSPLSVYSRDVFVFCVSPTTAQILATDGSGSAPAYSFASDTNTGIYRSGADELAFVAGGVTIVKIDNEGFRLVDGTSSDPPIYFPSSNSGIYATSGGLVFVNASTEFGRWTSTGGLVSTGPVVHKSYTVATLPAAASYTYGIVAVSDATDAAGTNLGVAPTGGGAVKRMVYSDGAAWLLM